MNRSFQSEQTCRVVIIEHSLQIIQKIFQLGEGKLIYDQIKREVDILSRKYDKLQQQLLKMPEGELLCAKNGDYTKWYLHNDKTLSYISKRENKLAEKLALKKYYEYQMQELEKQIHILEKCAAALKKVNMKSEYLLREESPYWKLLKIHFEKYEKEKISWMNGQYKCNPSHPENLIHKTMQGHLVRSKSEVIIANTLYMNQIPYRYENQLEIKGVILYPDFTILHPKTNNLCYWEHFGMMENETYRENAYNKLKLYGQNGIIPSINLITTFETKSHPIDSGKIQQIVKEKFVL